MTRTNMTEFPEGLMGPFPAALNDVEFSVTNLSKLPDDIGERWHALSVLYFEKSEIRQVPASLFQIPAIVLSLMGNHIKHLPPLDNVHALYYIVDLSENPLQALPATVGLGAYMGYLNVEKSNISSLPSWIDAHVGFPYGRGSPYCLNVANDKPSAVGVGCVVSDPRGGGRVPLTVIDSKLPL